MTSEHNQGQQAAPTPPPPASGGGSPRWGLYIGGGCAVAAVLGFFAVLAVVALIFFLSSRPATPEPDPQPSPTAEPTAEPAADPQPEPTPGGGGLDQLIQEQVGDFTLEQIEEIPEAIEGGASDARQMIYVSPDGVELVHNLTAWSSPDVANEVLPGFVDYWESEHGFQVVEEFPVTIDDQQVGNGVVLTGEIEGSEVEVALWTNDVLVGEIVAPTGYLVDFYNNLPY